MPLWNSDDELFEISRAELFTAVIGDICDQVGLRHQFLHPRIRPLHPHTVIRLMIGRAMTVLEADTTELYGNLPFGKMLMAIDNLERNEIYVCAGASPNYALVGELMCTAMMARQAAGVLCDGYIRDADRILALNFPVFSLGAYGQDQKGRGEVLDYRVPVQINGIRIEPGDLIVGDIDGTLVVPKAAVEEVFSNALEKARAETTVRDALKNGMKVTDAFANYGIL
jgi:regulator of RNase E activity RraA